MWIDEEFSDDMVSLARRIECGKYWHWGIIYIFENIYYYPTVA
jgi:hypothetical protein